MYTQTLDPKLRDNNTLAAMKTDIKNEANKTQSKGSLDSALDWKEISRTVLISRALDDLEEQVLLPAKKVLYQFSARGHDVPQAILGSLIRNKHDSVSAYYRSRPVLLALGLTLEEAMAAPLAKSGGFSDGRDIGVVCNLPGKLHGTATVLPMSGDVGSQYTPAAGWAQSILYRKNVLKETGYNRAISIVLGGEASVATNGFWSALTLATTLKLPVLFYIEDNGYGISVRSTLQTPGANISQNLSAFKNLIVLDGDGSNVESSSILICQALEQTRSHQGPVLLRLTVPRLSGHSGQDTQAYKSEQLIKEERERDPIHSLKQHCKGLFDWESLKAEADELVQKTLALVEARSNPDPARIFEHLRSQTSQTGQAAQPEQIQISGGLAASGHSFPVSSITASPEGTRINMISAIRRTLEHELKTNPKLLVFGEDVGAKGGVHAATLGLQEQFGEQRVFDTSLSEEGIVGRAVGMAIQGLMPVVEIQFRKYADPATEQLNNCGTIRWRTNNRFAAPIVVRVPGGFAKCGDPWHSVSNEVMWAHAFGWNVVMPSNAEDATGLLRSAMRSNDPVIFFEHRHMYDSAWGRTPYPGDDFIVEFGKGKIRLSGQNLTIVSWGAMVEVCELAAQSLGEKAGGKIEIIDLRSIMPWDQELVLSSVKKTRRCLIVHEDGLSAGFGAEISATLAEHAFFSLDAPIRRIAVKDIPIPYNVDLMQAVVPNPELVKDAIQELLEA